MEVKKSTTTDHSDKWAGNSGKPFSLWRRARNTSSHGLTSLQRSLQVYSTEIPCCKGSKETAKSANTSQHVMNGLLIFSSVILEDNTPHKGINFSFNSLYTMYVSSLRILLRVEDWRGKRCSRAKLQICWIGLQKEYLFNPSCKFPFCCKRWPPRRALKRKPFLVAKEILTKSRGVSQSWE